MVIAAAVDVKTINAMSLSYDNPYRTTRLPVFARNMVATSHPLAAQAGLRMLQQGGNAVDAAVAAAAAMTICEPVSNGLGSDAFCILWDGQSLHGLNAAGAAPQTWTKDYFERQHGAGATSPPKRGVDSATVPGAVGAWAALSARFGRLPFADLMAPAIDIAERGYPVPVVVPTLDEEIFRRDRYKTGQHWHTIEGACYFREGDWQYVMYSGNCYLQPTYYIGYARAKTDETDLTKIKFEKVPDDHTYAPVIRANDWEEGTGHHSVIKKDGVWYAVYHARNVEDDGFEGDRRNARICRLEVKDGTITAHRYPDHI